MKLLLQAEPWASVVALVAVLRRQVTVLQRRVDGHHLQSECAALVLTLPTESSPHNQRRLRVALDLLHTLWVLDRAAWRRVVVEVLDVAMTARVVLPDVAALTVVVSVRHDEFPSQVNDARWMTLLDPRVLLTEDEARTKRTLIQLYRQQEGPDGNMPVIPLRLQFLVVGMAASVVPTYLTRVVEMVEAVRDRLSDGRTAVECIAHGSECASFVLDSLVLSLTTYEMTNGIARQVKRLHALGIRFHTLGLRLIHHDAGNEDRDDDTTNRDGLLTVLLNTPPDSARQTDPPEFFIETLVIDRADLMQFSAACTALRVTRCVKKVILQDAFIFDTPTERALKWEWLTRAIFAPSSLTSIKHVSISQPELLRSDVEVIANTLHAMNTDRHSIGDHALPSLTLRFEASEAETIEGIPLLLELVGENLEALSIYFWMGDISTDLIQCIQRTCPSLLSLDLTNVEIESMDVFLDAYERGHCRVHSLALHNVEVPNGSVTSFARALCNQNHKASRVIRELCIDSVGVDNSLDQANLDAFLALLETPTSPLEYLDLRVSEPLLSQNRSRFIAHHDTWGSDVAAPLSTACKTAFLSVCKPRLDGRNSERVTMLRVPSQMAELDHHVVGLIFQFAATRSKKSVHFR